MSQAKVNQSAPSVEPQQKTTPLVQSKPEPVRAKELAGRITSAFPGAVVNWMKERRLKVTIGQERIKELSSFIRDDLGFDHISSVSGADWIAKNELEVIYFVGSMNPGWLDFVIAVAELVARENPVAPTLIEVWPGAEYHERETHEMFGINFVGHPDQSHLLLPEDWNDLPPLRKDYISPGR